MINALRRRGVLLLAILLLASGCARMVKDTRTPEEIVAERANARWAAVIEGQWQQAYDLLTPGYRAATDFDSYRMNLLARKINWTAASTTKVVCESAEKCTASVKIDYALVGGLPGVSRVTSSATADETWLKLDGQWLHLPNKTGK